MRWPLLIILALFVGLCCTFNAVTPYRQGGILLHQRDKDGKPASPKDIGAPDERQHAHYVAHLLAGKGFPVLVPGSEDLYETYQSHQPPLYYVLEAGWCKVFNQDPTDPKSGFLPRFLNAIIGALTLWGVYCLAKWAELDETVALGATAFVGLIPMFIGLHAAVSNDPLLYCFCTWGLAYTVKALKGGGGLDLVICGACLGLAILTKTTGLALAVVFGVAALLDWKKGSVRNAAMWVGAIAFGF
ncbi:MAG: glycosyltransferase family 39 protein, partial [Armatimonadota bacterium]